MLEWFGRRQTIALPINSVVGCLIATILLMILSENNVRTLTVDPGSSFHTFGLTQTKRAGQQFPEVGPNFITSCGSRSCCSLSGSISTSVFPGAS